MVGRGNVGWTTSESGHLCPCQNRSQEPPVEKTGREPLLQNVLVLQGSEVTLTPTTEVKSWITEKNCFIGVRSLKECLRSELVFGFFCSILSSPPPTLTPHHENRSKKLPSLCFLLKKIATKLLLGNCSTNHRKMQIFN